MKRYHYYCIRHIPEHSLVLQRLVSIVGPEQGLPPWLALVFTVRLLLCIPPPQEALHSVHRPYSPHSQLTNFNFQYKLHAKKYNSKIITGERNNVPGHLGWEQDLVSIGSPLHSDPPFLAFCKIIRFLCWVPVPQLTEHRLHSPYPDQRQLIGPAMMIKKWITKLTKIYHKDSHRSKVCERIRTSEKNQEKMKIGTVHKIFLNSQVYVASSSWYNNGWWCRENNVCRINIPIYFVICLLE